MPSHISLLVSALLATLVTSTVNEQQLPSYVERPAAAGVFAIWPGSGVPPGSEKWNWHEQTVQVPGSKVPTRMVRNVVIPTVTMYQPPARRDANGTALIVAPGGAFNFLMMDTEGYEMAHWLTQLGVTAFVLKYRVAHTPENDTEFFTFMQNLLTVLPHPGPTVETPPLGKDEGPTSIRSLSEEDGRQAIRFVRQHATEWGIDPNRIGIAGFSAGGVSRWRRRCTTTLSAGRISLLVSTRATERPRRSRQMRLRCLLPPPMTTDSSHLSPVRDSTRPGIRPASQQSCTSSLAVSTASG
jgi:hypothetical protein